MLTGEKKWFVAYVATNTEKIVGERLETMGYEVFVPTQKYISVWKDGRRKERERVVITGRILIHCTERKRLEVVKLSFVKRFMTDSAGKVNDFNHHPIAVIPQKQIDMFRFVLGQTAEKVGFNEFPIECGMKVRVVRGSLMGVSGVVTELNDKKTRVHINIDYLGSANLLVDSTDVEIVK